MTLEERLTSTLRRADEYRPSRDLFARVERSIDADVAHRARIRHVVAASVGVVWLAVAYLWWAVTADPSGDLVVRVWTLEVFELALLVGSMAALAPMIRRFGRIYVGAVFHLSPDTGDRFLRLLDLAYYLFFTGLIIVGSDLTALDGTVSVQRGLTGTLQRLAVFLVVMGASHAANLLLMPLVGLVYNALHRRGLRRAAGDAAPPLSARANAADRVSTWLVFGLAGIAAVGALLVIGIVIGLGVA